MPIKFDDYFITVGDFFKIASLNVVFDIYLNESQTWYCGNFLANSTLITQNPDRVIPLTWNYDSNSEHYQCRLSVNESMFHDNTTLFTNFTLKFSCPNCTQAYRVGLEEYYVN